MTRLLRALVTVACVLLLAATALASAYNAQPKLVVVIVIDQFRGDYLERWHDQFGAGGFRLLLDRGASFSDCYYDYATTFTAPGHATLLTGTYSNGHGIFANEWWDEGRKKTVTSVEDASTTLVGATGASTPAMAGSTAPQGVGASPHNLMGSTLGDELKLATGGKARVFALSLKDRAAVLPGGFAADAAFWIEPRSGVWVTSSYYMEQPRPWVAAFNQSAEHGPARYANREWKDLTGTTLRSTAPQPDRASFYDRVGPTPFSSEYEFDLARALIAGEKLGSGPATDLLVISISGFDILGHQVGPDAPELRAYTLALDRQLGEFFNFLGNQLGLANVWIALTADHGVAPTTEVAQRLRIPAVTLPPADVKQKLNATLAARLNARGEFVRSIEWPLVFLNEDAFAAARVTQADAEHAVVDALREIGVRRAFGKTQLAAGAASADAITRRFQHSYSPYGGWWVLAQTPPFALPAVTATLRTTHGSPYSYDAHVPLILYGLPFRAGVYRGASEPIDLAPTLASLLGINRPTNATGRVLTEAIAAAPR